MGGSLHQPLAALSPRELSVLELIAEGLSNEGIAERLSLNFKTIEGTIRATFMKLGLTGNSPTENRRVKAAVIYLESTSRAADTFSHAARDIERLMLSAPFDTLSALLEQRSTEAHDQGWALRATAAWFATIMEDFDRAGRLAARASELARNSITGQVITDGLVATLATFQGLAPIDHRRLDDAYGLLVDRRPVSPELAHLCATLEIANWFTFADRFAEASNILDRYLGAESLDDNERISLLGSSVELDLRRGRLQQAEARLGEISAMSLHIGASTGYADSLWARLHAIRGDAAQVRVRLLASRAAGLERGDTSTLWRADAAECLLLIGEGRLDESSRLCDDLRAAAAQSGLRLPAVRWWDLDAVVVAVRQGRSNDVSDLIDQLRSDVTDTGSPSGRAVLLAAEGLSGSGPSSLDSLRAAATEFERLGWPFERARVQLLVAERLVEMGEDGTIVARAAATLFEALQASTWAQTCHSMMS